MPVELLAPVWEKVGADSEDESLNEEAEDDDEDEDADADEVVERRPSKRGRPAPASEEDDDEEEGGGEWVEQEAVPTHLDGHFFVKGVGAFSPTAKVGVE